MLQHFLNVRVGDEKADVISLNNKSQGSELPATAHKTTYLDSLAPQDEEALRSLCQKPGEFVDKDVLYLVCLFYSYADSDTVDGGLYQDFLILISSDGERV